MVGDPRSSVRDLDRSIEELVGHKQYLTHVQTNLLQGVELHNAQQALGRRRMELEVSLQILETRKQRGFPSIQAGASGGGTTTTLAEVTSGVATLGGGTGLADATAAAATAGATVLPGVTGRLRALSESAATGGGFGAGALSGPGGA